jgi:Amt family ammonium transporter
MVATSAALIGWLVVEKVRDGKPTTLGAASGAVAGLVAITPACGYVSLLGGLAIGFIAGAVCALAVGLKYKLGFDDSLDVVGVHLVGGIVGTLLIGFFGSTEVNSLSANGLFYGGGLTQLWKQAIAAGAVMVYSFVTAFVIAFVIQKTIGFRVDTESEVTGIDEGEHAETGYDFSTIGGRASAGLSALSAAGVDKTPAAGVSTSSARQEG